MKIIKGIIVLMAVVAMANASWAQELNPLQIIWNSGNSAIPITEAKEEGIDLGTVSSTLHNDVRNIGNYASDLSIQCIFPAADMLQLFPDGVNYVVKWYYYMSTRRMLMSNTTVKVSASEADSQGMVTLLSNPKQKLRAGWWEVVIINKETSDSVRYAGNSQYQIFIK